MIVLDALFSLAMAVLGIDAVIAAHKIRRLEKEVRQLRGDGRG